MSSQYDQLLETTIRYLESAKADGVESVAVQQATLAALAEPVCETAQSTSLGIPAPPALAQPSQSPLLDHRQPTLRDVGSEPPVAGHTLVGPAKELAFAQLR